MDDLEINPPPNSPLLSEEEKQDDEKRLRFKEEEDKKKNLPMFETWFNSKMSTHPDYINISNTAYYYGTLTEMRIRRVCLLELSRAMNGKLEAESEEFKNAQKDWHFQYLKLQVLRSNTLQYYGVVNPNWQLEIMPERYYCGSLLSSEDFEKFVLGPGTYLKKLTPESEEKYATELRNKYEKPSSSDKIT